MRRSLALLLAVGLAGCHGSPAESPTPTASPAPTQAPLQRWRTADTTVVDAVLKGTAYVSPQAAGDILSDEAYTALTHRNFSGLTHLLEAARRLPDGWGAGASAELAFSQSLRKDYTYPGQPGIYRLPATYELLYLQMHDWHAACHVPTEAVTARMLEAKAAYLQAMQLLSGRVADYSQARMSSFGYWQFAEGCSRPVAGEGPSPARDTFPVEMSTSAAKPLKAPEVIAIFEKAPQAPVTLSRTVWYCGESSTIADFVKHLQGRNADLARLNAYVFTLQYPDDLFSAFPDWTALKAGYAEALKDRPDSVFLHNAFARAASLHGDVETARSELQKIGTQWDLSVWKSYAVYSAACASASVPPVEGGGLPSVITVGAEGRDYSLPVSDGRAFSIQILDLLRQRRYPELDEIANRLRTTDDPRLSLFYEATTSGLTDKSDFENRLGELRSWAALSPQKGTAKAALARFYIQFAWLARGSGYASTITTRGGQLFDARLEQARAALGDAADDADRAGSEITLRMAKSSGNVDEAVELAQQTLKKHPHETEVLHPLLNMLLPRWQGQPGDIPRAASKLASSTPLGKGVYAVMAIDLAGLEPDAAKADDPSHLPETEAIAGFARLHQLKLDTPQLLEAGTLEAVHLGDRATAARLLQWLGPRWDGELFQSASCQAGTLAWVRGAQKTPPFGRPTLRIRGVHWEEHGKSHPGSHAPARRGVTLVVELQATGAEGLVVPLTETMTHPPMTLPNGQNLSEHPSQRLLVPGVPLRPYRYVLGDAYEVVPGDWTFTIADGANPAQAQAHFTLTAP